MLGREFAHDLQLYNDAIEAHEVGSVRLLERLTLVSEDKRWRSHERDPRRRELERQAFLIDSFEESRPHLPANLEDGALDPEGLVREEHVFVFFVVHSWRAVSVSIVDRFA